MTLLAVSVQNGAAQFVYGLYIVYSILIVAYIVSSLVLGAGARVPYARWSSAVLGFLRDVCEPYLRIFRRVLPMAGPLDLSPLIGLFVLYIAYRVLEAIIGAA